MEWANRYVGIEFSDGGRSIDRFDCWGLVRLVLKQEAGIEVPSYGSVSARDLLSVARQMTIGKSLPPWVQVDEPAEFDVITMYGRTGIGKAVVHVGIMVDSKRVLHVEEKTSAVIVPFTHPSIFGRKAGFFRHEGLLADGA